LPQAPGPMKGGGRGVSLSGPTPHAAARCRAARPFSTAVGHSKGRGGRVGSSHSPPLSTPPLIARPYALSTLPIIARPFGAVAALAPLRAKRPPPRMGAWGEGQDPARTWLPGPPALAVLGRLCVSFHNGFPCLSLRLISGGPSGPPFICATSHRRDAPFVSQGSFPPGASPGVSPYPPNASTRYRAPRRRNPRAARAPRDLAHTHCSTERGLPLCLP
jgi:hypothetical protein